VCVLGLVGLEFALVAFYCTYTGYVCIEPQKMFCFYSFTVVRIRLDMLLKETNTYI